MKNRWNDADADAAIKKYSDSSEDLALRVYTSRLIGADPALVLHGGGNTSVKSVTQNRVGEDVRVLYVKGSGWDLDTLEPAGLPAVCLEPLLKLRTLDRLSDEDMVNQQRINLLDSTAPNPSVETLLHAFLPHKFIDHSHADASLVLANQPNAEELCRKIFGDTLAMVPYIMPGFALAKLAAEVYERHPQVKGLLLINHGLFTFGDTAQESYDRHIEAVTLAEEFIAKQTGKPLTTTNGAASLNPEQILTAVAPVLRGLYQQKSGLSWTVHHRQDKQSLEFANSEEASTWSQMGPATPDHVIRTKQKPLVLDLKNLDDTEQLWQEVDASLETYIENYHQYFTRNQQAKAVEKKELDPLPRVILLSGCGLLTIGKTGKETRISADLYQHTVDIIHKAFNVGAYAPLDDSDLFDMEYWSLEQAKLGKATPKKLQGKVVYISGAASGIGKATARLFAGQGANLFLVDCDAEKLDRVQNELKKEFKAEVAAQGLDLTDESAIADSFDLLVRRFGGLDILVSNAGNAMQGAIGEVDSKTLRASFDLNFFAHQNLASQAVNLYRKQKSPGVLLFNASKAAFNPGKNFGPYALPKAAVIALMKQYALEYGEIGIRSNAINADRIRTGIFPEQQVKERAAARGLSPDEYFKSNLLHREVYDVDVAQGFLDLVFAEKTTGSVLTIDGGNIAASPR